MKQFLEVGQVVTTHGLLGELKLYPWCDSAETLKPVKRLYLDPNGTEPVELVSVKAVKKMNILKIKGCDTVEQARGYFEKVLYADRADLALPPGSYFISDLIGLAVVHADTGERLGTVCEVTNNGAHDLYHVKLESGEVRMVPAVPAFVSAVDVEGGTVAIRPIKGMLDDAD